MMKESYVVSIETPKAPGTCGKPIRMRATFEGDRTVEFNIDCALDAGHDDGCAPSRLKPIQAVVTLPDPLGQPRKFELKLDTWELARPL